MCWNNSYREVIDGSFAEYFKSVMDADDAELIMDIEEDEKDE